MKAIILAAGRGSRMGRMTRRQPKCLLRIDGKALLDRQVAALRAAGIREIAIVTGYCRSQLARRGLKEFHNSRWASTNMVTSLACADAWLREDSCIVSYGDIFYGAGAVRRLFSQNSPVAITFDPGWKKLWSKRFRNPLEDAETFRISASGRILEIGQKPGSLDEIQGQYMGLLKFSPRGWGWVQKIRSGLSPMRRDALQMTQALNLLVRRKHGVVRGVSWRGRWGEVDQIRDLRLYRKKQKKPTRPSS